MAVLLYGALQDRQHIGGANRGRDMNRQTFAGEFIQDAQGFEETAIGQPIIQDVVGPDVIAMCAWWDRSSWRTRAGCKANPCCFQRR